MNTSADVLLGSTLHDPRGVFLDKILQASEVVLQGYKGWVINVTTTTDPRVKDALKGLEERGVIMTETDPTQPIVEDKIENDHLYLLTKVSEAAKKLGINKIQYTDGDRIITAAIHFPDDLRALAQRTSQLVGEGKSYVNFRRSAEDYLSHHPPLVETELEFNRQYSEVFGMPIDIGSTGHGMSIEVLDEVLHRSPQMEAVSFPHPKWLIIAKEMGAPIHSEETTNVFTFETPDQFTKEVKDRINEAAIRHDLPLRSSEEPYRQLQQDYMATLGLDSTVSPREWNLRFNTERQYLTLLKNHLTVFGYTPEKEDTFRNSINNSLVSLEGRHSAISEALSKTPDQVKAENNVRAENVFARFSKIES